MSLARGIGVFNRKCTPLIGKSGENCIGAAKTGSGKTAAFALPILQKLSEDPYGVFALVLTPTRYVCRLVNDAPLVILHTYLPIPKAAKYIITISSANGTESWHFKYRSSLRHWASQTIRVCALWWAGWT